jgi:hypothetical protein
MNKTIEYGLRATLSDRKSLLKLLDKGKNIYNLALSHCKKQLNKIRSDKEYTALLAERKSSVGMEHPSSRSTSSFSGSSKTGTVLRRMTSRSM